jgi:hypothetical protein
MTEKKSQVLENKQEIELEAVAVAANCDVSDVCRPTLRDQDVGSHPTLDIERSRRTKKKRHRRWRVAWRRGSSLGLDAEARLCQRL